MFIGLNLSSSDKCPSCCGWLAYLLFPNIVYIYHCPCSMLIQVVSLPNMPVFKLFLLSHILPSPNMQIKSHSYVLGAFLDVQASRAFTLKYCYTSFSKPSRRQPRNSCLCWHLIFVPQSYFSY